LFEHLHGESRARGTAMVELLERYRQHGLELDCDELPDHLPVFLEYLSLLPRRQARRELGPVAGVLRLLARRLASAQSPYAGVLEVLVRCAPRGAANEAVPPSRPMEQLIEREGLAADGREPLLTPQALVAPAMRAGMPAHPGTSTPGIPARPPRPLAATQRPPPPRTEKST
ncbi:MAG: nitrate reductase molybdenum cofactor assembly chaperone, partial [Steroidobacteraceae bacterium]